MTNSILYSLDSIFNEMNSYRKVMSVEKKRQEQYMPNLKYYNISFDMKMKIDNYLLGSSA